MPTEEELDAENNVRGPLADGHLAQLITSVIDRTEWSVRQIARRATKAGYSLQHTTVNQIRLGQRPSFPPGDIQKALAAGLGVPVEQVHVAAVRDYLGWDPLARHGSAARFEDNAVNVMLEMLGRQLMKLPEEERLRLADEIWDTYILDIPRTD